MPIGKITTTAGKGADYSAGSVNIAHTTDQSKLIPAPCPRLTRVNVPMVRSLSYVSLSYLKALMIVD